MASFPIYFGHFVNTFDNTKYLLNVNRPLGHCHWRFLFILFMQYMKNKKYYTAGTRCKIGTTDTQHHDCSLSWLGTSTSMKSDGVKLVL